MSKLPAFQFYPGDWMKDPCVRRCSLAARGVWVDILCLMFECEDRGVLASGGQPWTDSEIAAAVSGPTDVVLTCIVELLQKGVASRNQSGAMFSRRMVRDEQDRKDAKKRQQTHRHATVTQTVTPLVTDSSHRSSSSSSLSTSKREDRISPPPDQILNVENVKAQIEKRREALSARNENSAERRRRLNQEAIDAAV